MTRFLRSVFFIAGALCAAGPAWADNDGDPATDNIQRVVPYDGVLDLDGAGYNGLVDVIFTLYDSADGGEAVWTETWSADEERAITITGGRFSVNLGTFEDIETVIADAGQVYLGLQIKLPEAEAYTTLSGRQRLNPVPYALWGAQASNLTVAGDARFEGPATAVSGLTVRQGLTLTGGATMGGTASFSGEINADRIYLQDAEGTSRLFSHYSSYLRMGASGAFDLGLKVEIPARFDEPVSILDDLSITGDIDSSGDIVTTGDIAARDLTLSRGLGVDGDALVTGSLLVSEVSAVDLRVGGELTVEQKLAYARSFTLNEVNQLDTDIDSETWHCSPAGYRFYSVNITGDSSADDWIAVYTFESGGTWHINAAIDHESGNRENIEVGIFCMRKTLVDTANNGWFEAP